MGPQGGAEMRTKQTSDIILFNINFFFFISKLSWTFSFKYSQTRDSWSQRRHNGHKSWSRKLFGAHLLHENFLLGGWRWPYLGTKEYKLSTDTTCDQRQKTGPDGDLPLVCYRAYYS